MPICAATGGVNCGVARYIWLQHSAQETESSNFEEGLRVFVNLAHHSSMDD